MQLNESTFISRFYTGKYGYVFKTCLTVLIYGYVFLIHLRNEQREILNSDRKVFYSSYK
jgi:hypothetical protein